jgi:hypothetical protein
MHSRGFTETCELTAVQLVPVDRMTCAEIPVYARSSNINKVDATMESIREQMDLSNEISDAISNPVNMGIEVDDVSQSLVFLLHRLLGLPVVGG